MITTFLIFVEMFCFVCLLLHLLGGSNVIKSRVAVVVKSNTVYLKKSETNAMCHVLDTRF